MSKFENHVNDTEVIEETPSAQFENMIKKYTEESKPEKSMWRKAWERESSTPEKSMWRKAWERESNDNEGNIWHKISDTYALEYILDPNEDNLLHEKYENNKVSDEQHEEYLNKVENMLKKIMSSGDYSCSEALAEITGAKKMITPEMIDIFKIHSRDEIYEARHFRQVWDQRYGEESKPHEQPSEQSTPYRSRRAGVTNSQTNGTPSSEATVQEYRTIGNDKVTRYPAEVVNTVEREVSELKKEGLTNDQVYRKMSLKYHPDLGCQDQTYSQAVNALKSEKLL